MGQHATIHAKNNTAVNGASGSWVPVAIQAVFGPPVTSGTKGIDTQIKSGAGTFYGLICNGAGTASVYNGTTASDPLVCTLTGAAAGAYISIIVDCPGGIFLDWTSGSFSVIYA
jgi:hypothetical protein